MKHLCILMCLLCLFQLACAPSESPMQETAPKTETTDTTSARKTTIAKVAGIYDGNFYDAPSREPELIYVIWEGLLIQTEMVFEQDYYYLIPCAAIGGETTDPGKTFLNVLDNRIPTVNVREIEAVLRKEIGKQTHEELTIEERFKLADRIGTATAIGYGEELEVVIKHRFTYNPDKNKRTPQHRQMIFVDVLRNKTRPHIKFQ